MAIAVDGIGESIASDRNQRPEPRSGFPFRLVDQMLEAMSGKVLNRKLSILRPYPSIVFDSSNVNREVPKGTKAGDWSFAGGAYRGNFLKVWNKLYA